MRKRTWESRYAQLRDAIFQYKMDKYSINARFIIDIRQCQVLKGTLDNKQNYYEIREKNKSESREVVRIKFLTQEDYLRWGQIFKESMVSDSELREKQLALVRKKEEE